MLDSTKQQPKRVQNRVSRKTKHQPVAAKHVVADEGHAARLRLFARAPADYRAISKGYTVTWLRHRLREYVQVHGYASSGVCALLERAAEQYADCDWLRANAAANGATAADLKQAAQHAQLARSHELAAYELAAREGVAWRSQQDAGVKQHRTLAKSLSAETNSEPNEWGGVDGTDVDAWGKPDPAEVVPDPTRVGGGPNSDRPSLAAPPPGVDSGEAPFPPQDPQNELSPSPGAGVLPSPQ